jgi:anti-anti-sigma factor
MEGRSAGTIQVQQEGPTWVVVLRGEHDLSTAPDLERALEPLLEADVPVVVDLADVSFLDSVILRSLLTARDQTLTRRQRSFAVVARPDSFASKVLGHLADTLIPTFPDLAAALTDVAPGVGND